MPFAVDRSSDLPLPHQIKLLLADRIRSGLLAEGSRLPAVRALAAELGVSPVTVMHAYAGLEGDGLVIREQGRGVFVRVRPKSGRGSSPAPDPDWQEHLPDYIPRAFSWTLFGYDLPPGVIPMHAAILTAELVPLAELMQGLYHTFQNEPAPPGIYSPVAGAPRLRPAVARFLSGSGVPVHPDEVLITQGAQQGIDLVARTFVGPGDAVAAESLAYPPVIDAFKARGARLCPVPVDGEGMRVDLLADIPGLRLVYTVPTYQNPTGAVLSRRRRADLLELARERDILILEDDPWREIHFGKEPPLPLKSEDRDGHVIYVKSFSILLAEGVRIGAVIASHRILQRLMAAKSIADLGTSWLPQMALQAFLDSPRMARYIRRLVPALKERCDVVLHTLEAMAPQGVRWTTPDGGLNLWLTLPDGLDAEKLLPLAVKRGVAFAPGTGFFVGEPLLNHLRISYGAARKQELARGVRLLCEVLRESMRQ